MTIDDDGNRPGQSAGEPERAKPIIVGVDWGAGDSHSAFVCPNCRTVIRIIPEALSTPAENVSPTVPHTAPNTWPKDCQQVAFVAGARWWSGNGGKVGSWIWTYQRSAEAEAVKRYGSAAPSAPDEKQKCGGIPGEWDALGTSYNHCEGCKG